MSLQISKGRLLAFDPTNGGVGFVVLEGEQLVDWGVRGVARRNEASHRAVVYSLIDRYQPEAIIAERNTGSGCRRGLQARFNIDSAREVAAERKISFRQYSTRQVDAVFAQWNALTKEKRAGVLVETFPALANYRPPHRKPWMTEDRRMAIFDALSFAITHLFLERKKEETMRTIPF